MGRDSDFAILQEKEKFHVSSVNIKQIEKITADDLLPLSLLKYVHIIIGYPLSDPADLVTEPPWPNYDKFLGKDGCVFYSEDRFLPRALVQAKVFNSTSQVKRDRPDLFLTIPDEHFGWYWITYGSRAKKIHIFLHIGTKTPEQIWAIKEQILIEDKEYEQRNTNQTS